MSNFKFNRPQIPSHYYVWCEPPDSSGEESLHFVSQRRSIKLKGRAFAEFERRVIPLLDGFHTLEEIAREVQDVFTLSDLEAGLDLLAAYNVIGEGNTDSLNTDRRPQFTPQLNFLHELGLDPGEAQRRLHKATVTVFGMSGAGPQLAGSLAKSGIGCVRCVDDLPVSETDLYLSSGFSRSELKTPRALAVQHRLEREVPESRYEVVTDELSSDEAVLSAVEQSDYVASCLDAGQSSLIYKLNRVCLKGGLRWTSCSLAGTEIVIGPTIYPHSTACYLCYKMRVVACASNPEDAFAFEQLLDKRKTDDSSRRENLAISASIAANLLAFEIVRDLIGLSPATTAGKVIVFSLLDFSSTKHVVLKKPWCPACFPPGSRVIEQPATTLAAERR